MAAAVIQNRDMNGVQSILSLLLFTSHAGTLVHVQTVIIEKD